MGAATWIVVLSIALLLPNWRVLLALFEEEHVGNGLRAFSPSVQDWRMKGAYMRYKDHLIFTYRSNFNTMAPIKRTLLLLHGFPTCSFDFVPILAELEAIYERVIAYDYLGYGLSDKPLLHKYTLKEQAQIALQLLESWNEERVHVLAHDIGDTVAQELFALVNLNEANWKVEYEVTIMLNGAVFPHVQNPVLVQKLLLNPYTGPVVSSFLNYGMFRRVLSGIFGANHSVTEHDYLDLWDMIHYQNGDAIYHRLIKYMEERFENRQRWTQAIGDVQGHVAFLNGPSDPISGKHMAKEFETVFPQHHVRYLDSNVGHYPQLENPANTLEGIKAVLTHFGFLNKTI